MSGGVASGVLWNLRDCRTLSEHAKLAYLMLWSRRPDIRPSMQTLAGDMGTSRATAKRAVRELEEAGLLKKVPRLTTKGDPDSNRYELAEIPDGWGQRDPTPVHTDPTGGVTQTPEVKNNVKRTKEGRKSQGPRRARPALSRADRIALVRIAVAEIYGDEEDQELSDGKAAGLWDHLIEDRAPADPVAYLRKIFTETPYLDTHLANCEPDDEPW